MRKNITNNSEFFSYDFVGWWVEKYVNDPAYITPFKTKKHDN